MTYIFYDPKNLKVMGMSDDENSLEFPCVEVAESYHSSTGYDLIEEDGKIKVKPKEKLEVNFTKENEKHIKNKQLKEWRERINEGKSELNQKILDGKITVQDLTNFIFKYL